MYWLMSSYENSSPFTLSSPRVPLQASRRLSMPIIREIENEARGIYTGAIGFMGPRGQGVFNIPIRTVVLRDNEGELGIGSGIVYDSRTEDEYEEVNAKARFFMESYPKFHLIETLVWQNRYMRLNEHLLRLRSSAEKCPATIIRGAFFLFVLLYAGFLLFYCSSLSFNHSASSAAVFVATS